jgi:hypothetical protein
MGTNTFTPPDFGDDIEIEIVYDEMSVTTSTTGTTNEGTDDEVMIDDPGNSTWITATLTWSDEDVRIGLNNEPDDFTLTILDQNGDQVGEPQSSSDGRIDVSVNVTIPEPENEEEAADETTGPFTVIVTCDTAGDVYGFAGIFVRQQDNGNEWDLQVTVDYLVESQVLEE